MHPTLTRLLGMSRAELTIRLRERRDTLIERWAAARHARWPPPRLLATSAELREITGRLTAGDRSGAGRRLARHVVASPQRFPIGYRGRAELVRQIHATFPGAAADSARRADRICFGTYDLLGYSNLRFGRDPERPDWHLDPVSGRRAPDRFWTAVPYLDPGIGDHKVIWEINRHQHWLALGRASLLTGGSGFRERFITELRSWLATNPPYRGVNWASMLELAFRSMSWIWALHLFVEEDDREAAWVTDLLGGLDAQLDHIARHLSWFFSPNTHLLGEGLALYVAGRALPFLARADAWDTLGRRVLLQERTAQVHADGGHAEGSLHYHRYALDFYLLALAVARQTGDVAAGAFEETARRMAAFARAAADDSGRLMTIGDDDGGLLFPMCGGAPWDVAPSLAVAAALLDDPALAIGPPNEESLWMTGKTQAPAPAAAPAPSIHFPDSGYSIIRDHRVHVIVDTGRHGFLNGGHAHADALAVTLAVDGQPLLVDPGTATYTMDPEVRDRFRSTRMHNTVIVDGRDQSRPRGPFHWATRTDAQLTRWITSPEIDYAEGEHLAYAPIRHRRAVLRTPGLVLIADHLHGDGTHAVGINWHVHPGWTETIRETTIDLQHPGAGSVSIACSAGPLRVIRSEPGGVGWIAPVYGQLLPSLTLRHTGDTGLPVSFMTAVTCGSAMRMFTPLAAAVQPGDGGSAVGVSIADVQGTTIGLFSSRMSPRTGATRVVLPTPLGELATDARAAILRLTPEGLPLSLTLVDADEASWTGIAPFTIQRPMAELLHLDSSVLRQLSRNDEPRSVI